MLQLAQDVQKYEVDVDCTNWLHEADIATSQSVPQWQRMQGGSSLIHTFHIAGEVERDGTVDGTLGTRCPDLRAHKVLFAPLQLLEYFQNAVCV